MYYLQSRYYDPVVGRFINADGFASTGQGIIGCNMLAYCSNNPVRYLDSTGQYPVLRDFDLNGQITEIRVEWNSNKGKNERNDPKRRTLHEKITRTVESVVGNFEFMVGIGQGIHIGTDFGKLGGIDLGIHHDLLRVHYIDGQFDAYQYFYQGFAANILFFQVGNSEEKKMSYLSGQQQWQIIESQETWSLWGAEAYFFAGGSIAVSWDVLSVLRDIDEIW